MVMWNTSTKRLISWFQRVRNGNHKVAFTDWTPISKPMPLSPYVIHPLPTTLPFCICRKEIIRGHSKVQNHC